MLILVCDGAQTLLVELVAGMLLPAEDVQPGGVRPVVAHMLQGITPLTSACARGLQAFA